MKNYRVIVHFQDKKEYAVEAVSADAAEEEATRRFRQDADFAHDEGVAMIPVTIDWVENASEIASPVSSTEPPLTKTCPCKSCRARRAEVAIYETGPCNCEQALSLQKELCHALTRAEKAEADREEWARMVAYAGRKLDASESRLRIVEAENKKLRDRGGFW